MRRLQWTDKTRAKQMTNSNTTNESTVEIAREISYAIFHSQRHEAAAHDSSNTPEEQREHKRQTRAMDKATSEMLSGNWPQAVNIAGINSRGLYFVRSRTNAGTVYRVDTRAGTCTCEARGDCWHMSAALICQEVSEGEKALAEYLALRASVIAGNDESEAWLHSLGVHPYIEYIRHIAPERLTLPEPDEDIPLDYEAARFEAVIEHERAPALDTLADMVGDMPEIAGADEQDAEVYARRNATFNIRRDIGI